jgi:hypothetical protein
MSLSKYRSAALEGIMRQSVKRKAVTLLLPRYSCSKRMRPAAIRPLGVTGKVPVTDDEDGRHPKHENHGRIAGR